MAKSETETTNDNPSTAEIEPMEPVDVGEPTSKPSTLEDGPGFVADPQAEAELDEYDDGIQGGEPVDAEDEPSADKGDESEDEVEATAEPATVEFDDEIIKVAQQLGVSEQDARTFPTVGLLENHLRALYQSRTGPQTMQDQQTVQGQQVPVDPKPVTFGLPESLKDDVAPELYDAVNAQFKAVQEHYDGQLQQTKQAFAQMGQRFQQQESSQQAMANAQHAERFDGWVAATGDEYAEVLGEGATHSLPMNSVPRKNRQAIGDEIDVMRGGYAAAGKAAPSDKVLYERALRGLFGGKAVTVARKQVKGEAADRVRQATRRPAQRRNARKRTGEERAVDAVKELMNE